MTETEGHSAASCVTEGHSAALCVTERERQVTVQRRVCYRKRQRVIAQHRVCDRDRGSQCSIVCVTETEGYSAAL